MFRLLLLMAVLTALLDPLLLLGIALWLGLLPALAILILPGLLGGHLLRLQQGAGLEQVRQAVKGSPVGLSGKGGLADQGMLFLTGILLIYPGPLSSLMGLLFLIPPLRRGCAWILAQVARRGMSSAFQASFQVRGGRGSDPQGVAAGGWPGGGLKPVEGEAVASRPLEALEREGPALPGGAAGSSEGVGEAPRRT